MSQIAESTLTIEWSLLGFLAERPMHGYEIHQRLSEAAGLGIVWHIKQGALYTLLARLEDRDLISHVVESQDPRPPRKVYSLTNNGQAALHTWITTPVRRGRDFRLEFLAKVYFAWRAGGEPLKALFAEQRAVCRAWCAELQGAVDRTPPGDYEALVYRFRLGQVEAMATWLDESEATLKP